MDLLWSKKGWGDYLWWQDNNIKIVSKINTILKSLQRGERPIGKSEILSHSGEGLRSARLDKENRLIYKIEPYAIRIVSCRGHYE